MSIARLTDSSRRQINYFIAISLNECEQVGHSRLCPVSTDDGQYVAQDIGFGNCAVDITDDDLVVVVPHVDVTLAGGGALVGGSHS